jgi:hypothetical protein
MTATASRRNPSAHGARTSAMKAKTGHGSGHTKSLKNKTTTAEKEHRHGHESKISKEKLRSRHGRSKNPLYATQQNKIQRMVQQLMPHNWGFSPLDTIQELLQSLMAQLNPAAVLIILESLVKQFLEDVQTLQKNTTVLIKTSLKHLGVRVKTAR